MHKSEKFWDRLAHNYDKPSTDSNQSHNKTVEKIIKYIESNDIVLDYGCATGSIAIEIANNVKKIYGIDISSKMIQAAKSKAKENKIENASFAQTTVFNEKYKKESFDVILAFNVLHLLEDAHKVIQRINELLKPGGLIISSTACLGEKNTFLTKLLFFLTKIRIAPYIKFFKITELKDSFINENFQIIETENEFQGKYSYFIAAKKM